MKMRKIREIDLLAKHFLIDTPASPLWRFTGMVNLLSAFSSQNFFLDGNVRFFSTKAL